VVLGGFGLFRVLVTTLEPKRNETQFEDVVMENYRNEEVGLILLGLAKACAVIENHRDYRGRKFRTYLTRIKPDCVDVNQLESLVQRVQGCIFCET